MDGKTKETAEFIVGLTNYSRDPEELSDASILARALLEEAAEVERLKLEVDILEEALAIAMDEAGIEALVREDYLEEARRNVEARLRGK